MEFQVNWLKKLITLHKCTAKQMDNIISTREDIPKWMTLGKTVLCQEDPTLGGETLARKKIHEIFGINFRE